MNLQNLYYIIWRGHQSGPFTEKTIRTKIERNEISSFHRISDGRTTLTLPEWEEALQRARDEETKRQRAEAARQQAEAEQRRLAAEEAQRQAAIQAEQARLAAQEQPENIAAVGDPPPFPQTANQPLDVFPATSSLSENTKKRNIILAAIACVAPLILLVSVAILLFKNSSIDSTKIAELLENSTVTVEIYGDIAHAGYNARTNEEDTALTREVQRYDKSDIFLGLGSGFVIDKEKQFVVTNNHVARKELTKDNFKAHPTDNPNLKIIEIRIPKRYSVMFAGKTQPHHAEILKTEERVDLTILRVNGIANNKNIRALQLGDSLKLKKGDRIFLMGSPGGGERGSFSSGYITALDRIYDTTPEIQHSAPTTSGNSGGPVVNESGEVIGIHHAGKGGVAQRALLNLAIPVHELKRLLSEIDKPDKGGSDPKK
ncbi:MAG: serine protease [Puniceicoccales bacterium]|jgi:S1-C subfamily serine protease|nr:serine protease [Puniceicoccales bacterium]